MPEPNSLDEYNDRFADNAHVSGFGGDVVTHIPCPWCAAPDFQRWPITDPATAMQQVATCRECGRAGRIVVTENESDSRRIEVVQTGGPDAPTWMDPAPRRIDTDTIE